MCGIQQHPMIFSLQEFNFLLKFFIVGLVKALSLSTENACSTNPCLNNGLCQSTGGNNSYICSCQSGYSGVNCQITVNYCQTNPCINGGSCVVNSVGLQVCQCAPGFSGTYCHYQGNCSSSPCQNNATCVNQVSLNGNYYCQCAPNYYGINCEYKLSSQICNGGDLNATLCSSWSYNGLCNFLNTYNSVPVSIYCPTSCGICEGFCKDSQPNCAVWKNMGFCSTVNKINPLLCTKSCGTC